MKHVHIIGGGIVGLCSAWYLREAGAEVTVIDNGDFTEGTSFGNAGMIVPSHFVPMAAPGVISQGLKWLLDSKSPFYVRPRLNLELLRWILKFRQCSTADHVHRSADLLHQFNLHSRNLYRELSQALNCDYQEKGLLMLYRTRKQAEAEEAMAEQALRLGIQAEVMTGTSLQSLEPEMDLDVLGGLYFPGDAHLYPDRLMQAMVTALKVKGVSFNGRTQVLGFERTSRLVTGIRTASGLIEADEVLVASGSWSARLTEGVGIRLPLQDGKGYSITIPDAEIRPRIPTILAEAKVAITPMGNDLRVGGTLELSGMRGGINPKRVQGIVESVPRYYKNWSVPFDDATPVWTGYRPCTPDGLPYVGRTSISNLSVATGHGMMGLSLGAATGKLMAQTLTGQETTLKMEMLKPERFNR